MNNKSENKQLKESLAGMLESYELLMTSMSFNGMTKRVIQGAFIGEIEKARNLVNKKAK